MTNLFANPLLQGYPLLYKGHVLVCLFLGNMLTFCPSLVLFHPLWIKLHSLFGLVYVPPTTANAGSTLSNGEMQNWSNIGILLTAIGTINIAAANQPGGIPVAREFVKLRMGAAVLIAAVWIIRPESRDLIKALVFIKDGFGGLVTSWQMGGAT